MLLILIYWELFIMWINCNLQLALMNWKMNFIKVIEECRKYIMKILCKERDLVNILEKIQNKFKTIYG